MIAFSDLYIIGPPGIDGGGGGGEANDGANVGTGLEVYKDKSGVTLRFRTLVFTSEFDVTQNADDLDIDLSNTGVVGGTYINPTLSVSNKGRITVISSGAEGEQYRYLQAESLGQVSATIGYFSRATVNQNNPGGLALTNSNNQYNQGQQAPFLLQGLWRVVDIKVLVSAAATGVGSVGAAPTFRLDIYQINTGNRTAIATVRLPCIVNPGEIGINNTLTNASTFIYFAKSTFSPEIEPANSTLFGWEFVNEGGSNLTINAYSRATSHVILKKIG
jgi:hypothetical protein